MFVKIKKIIYESLYVSYSEYTEDRTISPWVVLLCLHRGSGTIQMDTEINYGKN
jgi:hypothetical protein